jgi:hypothetical protein
VGFCFQNKSGDKILLYAQPGSLKKNKGNPGRSFPLLQLREGDRVTGRQAPFLVAIPPAPFLSDGRSGARVGGEPGNQSMVYISTSSFPSFGLLGLDLGCSSPVLPFGAVGGGACSGVASRWCGLAFLVIGHAPRRLVPRGVPGLPPLRRLRWLALGGELDLGALGDASMASLQSWGLCVVAALLLYTFLEACVGGALAVGVALLADESSCRWLGGAVLHQPRCPATASSWRRWNLLILRFGASTEHVRLV